ncbi:MAG: signal peptide peptidase SppA [Candidatus Paceibacteria bacterium]
MATSIKREVFSVFLRVFAVVLTIVLIFVVIGVSISSFTYISDGECNVAVVPIEGVILPFSGLMDLGGLVITPGGVQSYLDAVLDDSNIKAVLFEINSPGGTPVAAESITELIRDYSLPTVALIGDMGASGGYMVATGADRILASRMSDVGGIGVTMSYVEESIKNEEEGRTFVPLSTGRFKDAGNPDKPLTPEERALFEAQLEEIHDVFVSIVAENRSLDIEVVRGLATGATMTGSSALEARLIDGIGNRREAKATLAELIGEGMSTEDIKYCEYNSYLTIL